MFGFRFSWLLVSLGVVLFISFQLSHLYQGLPSVERSSSSLASTLFEDLKASGLLVVNRSDWRIRLPEKDDALISRASKGERSDYAYQQKLINRLYYQPYGEQLKKQVKLWNYTRRLAAIRDNRPQQHAENLWKVSDENDLVLQDFTTVPLYFGYITQGRLIKGFHHWKGASLADRSIVFSTQFDLPRPQAIMLNIIGRPDVSSIAHLHRVTPIFLQGQTASEADTYRLVLKLPQGKSNVRIAVNTVANPKTEMLGIALAAVDKKRQQTINATLQNQCNAPNQPLTSSKTAQEQEIPTTEKVLVWNNCALATSGAKSSAEFAPFQIVTRDAQALTEPYDEAHPSAIGQPTQLTQQAGLTALMGQDRYDLYSLSGLMWHANKQKQAVLKLTLDSRLQKISQQALERGIQGRPSPKRRAAVVMLNAQTGEILAAANYPNPDVGVHLWDRKVISTLYPQSDPYRFNPWQGMTGDNAPGSTFKVVTAMAALKAAPHNTRLAALLAGSDMANYKRNLGLDPDAKLYHIPNTPASMRGIGTGHTIRNAAGALFDARCRQETKNRGVVGLPEATKDSLNNWYAHLGIVMDAANLRNPKQTQQRQQLPELVNMANYLGFNRIASLDTVGLQRYKANGNGRGDILNAYAGSLDLAAPYGSRTEGLIRLAQNSFGQGLTTTPLQMAKVAASIATGKNIQPQLFLALANKEARQLKQGDLNIPNLDSLRDGMKAVVQTGTAKGTFKGNLKCNVYGKTGTAEVGLNKASFRISPWFMGWYAPNDKPTLAFACMATHYPRKTGSYGGSICAPIINEILQAWTHQEKKQ